MNTGEPFCTTCDATSWNTHKPDCASLLAVRRNAEQLQPVTTAHSFTPNVMEGEILPSAIETICARFKKAADIYCQKYPRDGWRATPGFEAAVSSYERHKRQFNRAVEEWIKTHGQLPEWARDAVIYQMERGFLDRLWLTWDEGAVIPWQQAKQALQEPTTITTANPDGTATVEFVPPASDLTLGAAFIPCHSCDGLMLASGFGLKIGDTLPEGGIFLCKFCAEERRREKP